ncbi:DUF397 domain-containing protein [Kitasatospora sp. NPDC056184]|uniref:DUF397 domain-containing protein n=1 Tax=Kitasatospora sp. NPDC056184 TaxID=3345738 RepID=UPI0035DD17B6
MACQCGRSGRVREDQPAPERPRLPGHLRIALGSDQAGSGHRAALRTELTAHALVAEIIEIPDDATGRQHPYSHVALAAGRLVADGTADGTADRVLLICHSGGRGDCLEVAEASHLRHIRDSKDPHGPVLAVTAQAFAELLRATAAGEFDNPGRPR